MNSIWLSTACPRSNGFWSQYVVKFKKAARRLDLPSFARLSAQQQLQFAFGNPPSPLLLLTCRKKTMRFGWSSPCLCSSSFLGPFGDTLRHWHHPPRSGVLLVAGRRNGAASLLPGTRVPQLASSIRALTLSCPEGKYSPRDLYTIR